jgi:hypothetical protein
VATERHGADLVGGGGLPNIGLEQDTAVLKDDTQRQLFRKEWREIHGAGQNVPAILPPGMKIKTLTFSMEDLQFLSLRQHNIEEMARWYDLPPHTLHHLLRMTNNNVEQLSIDVVRFSFVPWIVPDEQEYLRKLIPDEEEQKEYYFKYEVNGLLRGDSASRAALYHNGIVDGWLSPNEVRELEDWNPYEGGDEYFIQGAMVRVDQVGMVSVVTPLPDPEEPADGEESDAKEAALKSCARTMLREAVERVLCKECTAARRESRKPREFTDWIEVFYEKHECDAAKVLSLPMQAAAVFGVAVTADSLAAEIATASKAALSAVTDTATADTLAVEVERLVAEWERSRAADIVSRFSELN